MSKPDAERALEIYKNFTKQTDFVVAYLSTARQFEHQTRVEVPKLKHAPVNLGKQLEDYLMDPDFEINRRQYMAEQESKKGRGTNGASKPFATASKSDSETRAATGRAFPDAQTSAPKPSQPVKGPDPDLIDFFDSIEQNQQPMASQPGMQQPAFSNNGAQFPVQQPPYGQQNGFVAQQNPYQSPPAQFQPQSPPQQQPFNTGFNQPQQIQPNFTGAGFGVYTPQPSFQPGGLSSIPQNSAASFQPQNNQQISNMQTGNQPTTNPFRQSMMANPTGMASPPSFTASPPATSPLQRQSTNPFAKSVSPQSTQQTFSPQPGQQQPYPQTAPLPSAEFQQPMATGTNPFARNLALNAQRPQTSRGLVPQPTGSTNPFRQSQFVNTATGSGWQNNQQPIGGGLDSLETVPVFPRPAQQQPWQQ
jgi:hypothetical protein